MPASSLHCRPAITVRSLSAQLPPARQWLSFEPVANVASAPPSSTMGYRIAQRPVYTMPAYSNLAFSVKRDLVDFVAGTTTLHTRSSRCATNNKLGIGRLRSPTPNGMGPESRPRTRPYGRAFELFRAVMKPKMILVHFGRRDRRGIKRD